jgi:site-specific DNA recombinase
MDISYLRVSTAQQRDAETIETQRYILERHFELHGIAVPDGLRFEDDGVSGGIEIHKRPSGQQVYSLISSGKVKRLFLFHSDRVGRDTIDTLLFHRLAENHGTQIIGIADGTDTFREGSILTTEIRAVIAAEYRRDASRRTTAGLRRRVAAKKITTRPPFGYTSEDGFLFVNPEQADVLARAFLEFAKGRRTKDIVSDLNREGAISPRGNGWRHDSLIILLKRRCYMGEYVAFRTPKKRLGGGRTPRDPKEQVIIPCPAIVSRELFETVQERIEFNRRHCRTGQKRFYLLKGLMRCARCGNTYVGHAITGRKYKDKRYADFVYYECGSLSNRDYPFCGSARINARRIESTIWEEIESFIATPERVIEQLTVRYNQRVSSGRRGSEQRLKKLTEAKRKNGEARERLALAVARGVLVESEVLSARAVLDKELLRLEDEERNLLQTEGAAESHRRQMLDAQTLLMSLRVQIEKGFTTQKRMELTRYLVREAKVNTGDDGRPNVNVQYMFPMPSSFVPDASALKMSLRRKKKARP